MDSKLIYKSIKSIRLQKGISQEFMAEKLGLSLNSYGRTERGETELTVERLIKIAELLETSLAAVVGASVDEQHLVDINETRTRLAKMDEETSNLLRKFEEYKRKKDQQKLEREHLELFRKYLTAIILPPFVRTYGEASVILKENGFHFEKRFREEIKEATKYMADEDKLNDMIATDEGLRDFLQSLITFEEVKGFIK